jgi:hypothetical protein
MSSYEGTSLKCYSRDGMIKSCQTEMINSHTSSVLEIARESIHPVFERANRHRTCLTKWIIGATDLFEDIKHNKGLSRGVTKICRLCHDSESEESRVHLLLNCQATYDLRNHDCLEITQEDRDIWDRLTEQERVTFLLNSFETPIAARSSDQHRRVERGQEIKRVQDIAALLPDNAESLQIGLNCKRNENKFTIAYEILTVKEEIAKGSLEVETKDESEACSQGIIAALTAMKSEIPSEELPTTVRILCMNSLLANSLPQARQKPEKSRALRLALQEIDNIPEGTKIIAHHISREVGLHLMRHICLPETHQRTTLKVESEKRRAERWQANTDRIATLIYQINQRLKTRKSMEKHRGYR